MKDDDFKLLSGFADICMCQIIEYQTNTNMQVMKLFEGRKSSCFQNLPFLNVTLKQSKILIWTCQFKQNCKICNVQNFCNKDILNHEREAF